MHVLFPVVLCGLPIAAGIAILRYRLYEIDRVINRTLVYGALTAAVIGRYAAVVLAAEALLKDIGSRAASCTAIATTRTRRCPASASGSARTSHPPPS